MNFVTEEQFNTCLGEPQVTAEVIRMLAEDMAVCIAIIGGPEATEDTYKRILRRILDDLEAGVALARKRLDDHFEGKSIIIPRHH